MAFEFASRFQCIWKAVAKVSCGAIALLLFSTSAHAHVTLAMHSFNGSVLWGRYPHAFIVLEGTLERDGRVINENYGFTAVKMSTDLFSKNVRGTLHTEKQKYITSTNVHFKIRISDAVYDQIEAELPRWRDIEPAAATYNLNTNNCVHFVARIAQIAGYTVAVPKELVKKPRGYLNLFARHYPELGSKVFD